MHDRLEDLKDAADSMSNGEKLQLIEYLTDSLRPRRNGEAPGTVERQRQAFLQLQEKLIALPHTDDPYAKLGYSNETHDKIIYDLEQK